MQVDLDLKVDPKFEAALSYSAAAYKAESDERYEAAAASHSKAIEQLAAFTKKGGVFSFLSTEKRRVKRQAETKITLHRERLRALELYVGNADVSTKPLVPAVTDFEVARQLGARDGSKKGLHEAATARNPGQGPVLSLQEIQHPQQQAAMVATFTKAIAINPPETMIVRRPGNTAAALEGGYVFTVKDATETSTLYILEAQTMHSVEIPIARLSRAGEYPYTSALVKVWPAKPPQHAWETRLLHRGRPIKVENNLLPEGTIENPDQRDGCPWGPRRFIYGGHKFVWKPKHPEKKQEDGNFETLYEYTQSWLNGSGTMDDDAEAVVLCWCDPVPSFIFDFKWTIHFAAGLDPLFKEHLLASQLAKMAAMHANSKHGV